MALFTNLQSLSQTAGANPPDGSADAPSTIPTDLRLLGSFDAIMRDGGHQWGSTVGGTVNAIAITVNGISSLVAGQTFKFVATGANTGAVTLNVNSLGAKTVNKHGTSALVAGDIASLSTVTVTYDGTNFQLTGVAQSSSLNANGWAKFSNGLILQWGGVVAQSVAAGTTVTTTVTFPIAFPNAAFAVVPSNGSTGNITYTTASTNTPTTTGFNFYAGNTFTSSQSVGGAWVALGN